MPSVCRTTPPRRGAVMVWLVLCLGVIITIVALGTDGGRMMEERRRAQAAADAAALAAAADLYQNYQANQGLDPSGSAAQAAQASAASNGYAASAVTVNVPPQNGTFTGQAGYVEVLIQSHLQGSFSAAFSSGDLAVRARAVARGTPLGIGLTVLRSSGASAFNASGSAVVQVVNGPVLVNSSDPAALTMSGSTQLTAPLIAITGGYQISGGTISGPIATGAQPAPDPLRTFPEPDPTAAVVQRTSPLTIGAGTVTLQPGVYQGGISINGSGSATLLPGVYIINGGGFQLTGQASVTGLGVMLYNTGGSSAGPVNLSGNGAITLTPPTDGVYRGISIFQDRSVSQTVSLSGEGAIKVTGMVYAAGGTVNLSGNGTSTTNTLGGGYVANTLQISGSSIFTINLGALQPLVPDVRLVE